jgi:hypothetical protein
MVEIADIFRLHGPEYQTKFGDRMPSSHSRVMHDIETCRTPALGGQLYVCTKCAKERYSYHSCKNRHCPKCQNDQATQWLRRQESLLLPVGHFLVTFTFPEELRPLARSNQQTLYNILFRASSQALAKLAADPRYLGAQLGMIGVLHTWTRDLRYHPHVHYVVTGGGIDNEGHWRLPHNRFLVPGKPLALIFRAKVRDMLRKAGLLNQVDNRAWHKDWVVDLEPVGSGSSTFKYLATYIFRVAISNNRIISLDDGKVTFKYKDRAAGQTRLATLSAEEFIRRFLQHVLPLGFVKVRYYGLLSPSNRRLLQTAKTQLGGHICNNGSLTATLPSQATQPQTCTNCGGPLILIAVLAPLKPP